MERGHVIETVADQIKLHLAELETVRNEFPSLASEKPPLLVVDTTFQRAPKAIKATLQELTTSGWKDLSDLYIENLFGGDLPQDAKDVFGQLFGSHYALTSIDICDRPVFPDEDFSGVIFSGSSANVTQALTDDKRQIYEGVEMTHKEVLEHTSTLYSEAMRRGLPVIGLCYGHQVISHHLGATVYRQPHLPPDVMNIGDQIVTATDTGREFLTHLTQHAPTETGRLTVAYAEVVRPNPDKSMLLYQSTEPAGSETVQGLLHIAEGKLSGDKNADLAYVNKLLRTGKHVALTLQTHPEYTGVGSLVSFALSKEKDVGKSFGAPRRGLLTAETLRMFLAFLNAHGADASSR